MIPFIILFCLQLIIAGIVIFVLKQLLDKELEQAALEKAMALKNNPEIKSIHVYSAKDLSVQLKEQLTSIVKNKFSNGKIIFEHLSSLKGGLIIKVEEQVLDFSLSSRLEHLWS
jgi:F0F1-type ATP synthase delta subunit